MESVEFETVRLELDGRVARIVLNRPEVVNAVNRQMELDVTQALAAIAEHDESRVVIVKGAGRGFCSGYDLDWAYTGADTDGDGTNYFDKPNWSDTTLLHRYAGTGSPAPGSPPQGCWTQLWYFPKPTIAQIHGYCYAGGCMVGLNCDLVFAAQDALIGQPEVRAQGMCQDFCMWPHTLGPRMLKQLLFTGDPVDGREAAAMGMINRALPPDELEAHVEWMAARIAGMHPGMLTYAKLAANNTYDILGLPAVRNQAAVYDSLMHFTGAGAEFGRQAREGGVGAALAWRDGPFGRVPRVGEQLPRGPRR